MTDIGIIGYGNMGQAMAEEFRQIDGVRIAAVAEVAPQHIQKAQAHGLKVFTDYRRLLDLPLHGVYVATPNTLHREQVIAAAARGLAILCEKPIALDLAAADDMLRAAQAERAPVMVNFIYRFTDAHERLRGFMTSGQLGSLLACWFRTFRGYGFYASGVRHPAIVHPELSGGWVIHHTIHAADWLVSIGGPVASVAAQTFRSSPDSPGPEGIFALISFRNGAVAHLSDAVVAFREHPAGIVGTNGTVAYDKAGSVRFQAESGIPDGLPDQVLAASEHGYLLNVARHFTAVARREIAPRVTLADGRYALALVLALLQAAETGTTIALNEHSGK